MLKNIRQYDSKILRNALLRTLILLYVAGVFMTGCNHSSDYDRELTRIYDMTENAPDTALYMLNKLDCSHYSKKNRYFYNLTLIKARDKAFVVHNNDSLIKDLLKYYSDYQKSDLYPEVLYYAGRVYCDLGDMPEALKYYQMANDITDDSNTKLKGCILSQLSWAMTELRLYKQAIPVIQNALRIDSLRNDTVNLIYDLEMLGDVYRRLNRLDDAENIALYNYSLASKANKHLLPDIKLDLAIINYKKGNVNKALNLIRHVPENISRQHKNYATYHAIEIYYHANKIDTAFKYANSLIRSQYEDNKISGYRYLLSPKMRHLSPYDSLLKYTEIYDSLVEKKLNSNSSKEAIIQSSLYNYNIHLRDKESALQHKSELTAALSVAIFVIILLVCIIIYNRYRHYRNIAELISTKLKLAYLANNYKNTFLPNNNLTVPAAGDIGYDKVALPYADNNLLINANNLTNKKIQDLRFRIAEEIEYISSLSECKMSIPEEITASSPYKIIRHHIIECKPIAKDSPIWLKIEELLDKLYPQLFQRMSILSDNSLSEFERRIIMLIRFGFSPTEMQTIFCKSKGTISYHRKKIVSCLLNKNMSSTLTDIVVMLL